LSNESKSIALPPVIVMAYDDEPLKLFALRSAGPYIHVVGHDRTQPIGFPADRVYVYDERRFRALRRAWEAKDADKLSTLMLRCANWHESP